MLQLLVVVLLFITSSAFASDAPLVRVAHYEPVINFQVDLSHGELSFIAYGRLWEFSIWLSSVHENNTQHFHGRLKDDPTSYASFSILHPDTYGMILLSNETFWLERKHGDDPALYIHKSSDVWFHPSMEFKCGHAGDPIFEDGPSINVRDMELRDHAHADGPPSVSVWLDQYWLNANMNPWYAQQSTNLLLNDVNAIYAAAGLHAFNFALIGLRSNSWTLNSQLTNMLNDFSAFAATGALGTANIGFWLSGNNIGGLAWIGTGCSLNVSPYFRTGLAGLASTSRLYTVKTIAHELGHLRGAQHYTTNQCAPHQTNNCQCSVMSYCFPTTSSQVVLAPVSVDQINRSCP